ncbi:MAG TPA: amidohydrolase family protein, partial [Planctomycetota bacterium]|nr:amidohydrolase family protein [Planctomycetota bacterium]
MQIANARIVTDTAIIDPGRVVIEKGRIQAVGPQKSPPMLSPGDFDARGGTLLPGFIDLHNHGALGHDSMELLPDHWRATCAFLARHGVTGFLPTLSAADAAGIDAYLRLAKSIMDESPHGARILGVHMEGPYLNPKYRGMHPMSHCRPPDPAEYMRWLNSGIVRRVTASMELARTKRLLDDCIAEGVLLSNGHSGCSADDMHRYVSWGLQHVTHLYNAMSRAEKQGPVRVCGCLEGALTARGVSVEIIGDGHHVPEHLFRIAVSCKGPEFITIASDATLFTGAVQEGVPMRYGGSEQEVVVRNGRATSPDASALIGSIAPLGEMFPRILGWLDGDWLAATR